VELNSIVADMFKTAYFSHRFKTHKNGSADRQGQHLGEFPVADAGSREISPGHLASHACSYDCRSTEAGLRPPSDISVSSSSDSAAEGHTVKCNVVGDGLGSISSITESVNSWSFRFPEIPSVASAAGNSAEEKPTLLIENRRQSQNIMTSVDTTRNSVPQNVNSQV